MTVPLVECADCARTIPDTEWHYIRSADTLCEDCAKRPGLPR